MPDEPTVRVNLPLDTAEKLHTALEGLLEAGHGNPALEEAYRVLAWRILAARGAAGGSSGLIIRMAELAREAKSVEEYEAARDEALGPILDGLESAENRDP